MDITEGYDGLSYELDEVTDNDAIPLLAQRQLTADDRMRQSDNSKLQNPLAEFSDANLEEMAVAFCRDHAISDKEDVRAFRLGAILAKDPTRFEKLRGMATAVEMDILKKEITHRWSQPRLLYLVIILCSVCAAVQGMGTFFREDKNVQICP